MEYINHNLDKDQIFNISKISSSRNDAIKIENQKSEGNSPKLNVNEDNQY